MPTAFRVVVCLVAFAIISVSNVSAQPRTEDIEMALQQAVISKIGAPYRLGGTDDDGYDCSGFVWRVLNDAGIQIERGSARDLWAALQEASAQERRQFGTLVFFNGLSHVGIVCDEHTFYHASTSQGVMLSKFADYWGSRIVGFRRASAPRKTAVIQRPSKQRITGYRFTDFSQALALTERQEGRKGKKGKVE
jgi:NlpC/P60 family protein